MASLKDERGYNQMFKPSEAMDIRTERRCDQILSEMRIMSDSQVSNNEECHVLEIGSGTGELAALMALELAGISHITGSDISLPFVEEATKRHQLPNLDFIKLDFNNPELLNDCKFDYIVGNGILHHFYDHLDETLTNIYELLKPNGKMIFWEPNLYNPYCWLIFNTTKKMRKWANLEPNEMALRKSKIEKQINNTGFSNINIKYMDFLPPNTPSWLINPTITIGSGLEKIPFLRWLSQSLFISAQKMLK